MQSADNGAMVVQDVQQAAREARFALRNFNETLARQHEEDALEAAKTTLHVAVVHYWISLRPWAATSDYYWDQVQIYKNEDGWVKGMKNLDPWIYSVETVEINQEDAVEGESTETKEVARTMPPQIAARAILVLDQLFRDSPFAPGQQTAPEREKLDQRAVQQDILETSDE
ncbi:hypothetical protein AB7C87_17100 [Natrarchaeobius sp. A-rgal3]|uniref:hypothetical protein n=1 Tax=Natrarchaeobius versutus TaxID=1679078 RepID=UPI003510C281